MDENVKSSFASTQTANSTTKGMALPGSNICVKENRQQRESSPNGSPSSDLDTKTEEELENSQFLTSEDQHNAGSERETSPVQDDDVQLKIPQQHGKLDSLLSQIPKKAQHGLLMQCDLILTCIDVNEHFVALGTNIGLAFLYNRMDHSMQRLKSETSNEVITCVKLHHGLDHQLALGMASGTLCIFLIPSLVSLHKKQLQKFDVRSVHRHYITCVEWSTNGMKLFSGDKTGHVVITEVDFYMGECKSCLLLVEPSTEVVQLHYDHKVLLVSTKHRSFICRLDTTRETVQVGQQDRKIQGSFGACFVPALCRVEDALLYAVRPGCRLWFADIHGTVCNTLIFKDQISGSLPDIPILQPSKNTFNPNAERQFGRLVPYRGQQLVTYNTTTLFVLDPGKSRVVASQSQLGGLVDVAVHKDEIFVLRRYHGDAVVRIANEPEAISHRAVSLEPSLALDTVSAAENEQKEGTKDENKTTAFFKKTFFTTFKKIDHFIQEHSHSSQPPRTLSPALGTSDSSRSSGTVPAARQAERDQSLPPVLPLTSPDLAVQVFPHAGKGQAESTVDVQSPDSADSALSVFADEVRVKLRTGAASSVDEVSGEAKVSSLSDEDGLNAEQKKSTETSDNTFLSVDEMKRNDDIIFSHHMHKKKGKKKKPKSKEVEKESDKSSHSSSLSQEWEEVKGDSAALHNSVVGDGTQHQDVDHVLQRAEEALKNFQLVFKEAHNENTSRDNQPTAQIPEVEKTLTEVTSVGNDHTDSVKETLSLHTLTSNSTEIVVEQNAEVVESVDSHTTISDRQDEQNVNYPLNMITTPESFLKHPMQLSDSETLLNPSSTSVQFPGDKDSSMPQTLSASSDDSKMSESTHSFRVVKEGEDPLVAAERSLDSMTKYSKLPITKEDSMDDFYSKFSSPYSPADLPESPSWILKEENSSGDFDHEESSVVRQISSGSVGSGNERNCRGATLQKLANNWSEFTTPANIYSLGLSSTHIWFTDKSENLYYSNIGGAKGIVWRKVGESANQICVSPSGHIVWRLHRGRVYAGTKITQRRPEGLKWVEAVRDVAHISVDDNCAWYVKTNGDIMMQRGLSKERPCFRSVVVESGSDMKQVMARYGVVWAISHSLKLFVRTGVCSQLPQGSGWHEVDRQSEPLLFSSVSLDNEGLGWAIDVLGQIWFLDGVTPHKPAGSGHWWQVPLSEYFVKDPTMMDMIRSIAKTFDPQKLSHIMSSNRGGLIVAGTHGVWLSLDYLNKLNVCQGSLQGYHWLTAQPPQLASSTIWKQVNASILDLEWGVVWAQRANGELFALPPDSSDATLVDAPVLVSLGVNEHTVWGLTAEGELLARVGINVRCPLGVDWTQLELAQLGDVHLVQVSCNSSYLWVVDAEGQVFHRIGAAAPRHGQLNPVWLPIDSYSEIIFTKVATGPVDWMVWAADNRRLTYVRVGISESLPIGREWIHVPGIQIMDIALSSSGVWALNTNGEILFRYGITEDNVSGNYWKKIPGCFTRISASSTDVLWAVDTSGQLVKCSSRHIFRHQDSADPLIQLAISNANSEEGDWELV